MGYQLVSLPLAYLQVVGTIVHQSGGAQLLEFRGLVVPLRGKSGSECSRHSGSEYSGLIEFGPAAAEFEPNQGGWWKQRTYSGKSNLVRIVTC